MPIFFFNINIFKKALEICKSDKYTDEEYKSYFEELITKDFLNEKQLLEEEENKKREILNFKVLYFKTFKNDIIAMDKLVNTSILLGLPLELLEKL